jgi:Tetracyclin repressor-like, C-terminal domain
LTPPGPGIIHPDDAPRSPAGSSALPMPAPPPPAHSIAVMTTPQMMALDQALSEIDVPRPERARWADQLAEVAHQLRAVIRHHRDVFPSSVGLPPGGGRTLRCHEGVLAIMRTGGLSDSRSVAGLYLLWLIVNGFSLEEARDGESAGPDLSPVVRQYYASLPGDRFPNLAAVAGEFGNTDLDERFDLLIGIFIDGLAQRRDG